MSCPFTCYAISYTCITFQNKKDKNNPEMASHLLQGKKTGSLNGLWVPQRSAPPLTVWLLSSSSLSHSFLHIDLNVIREDLTAMLSDVAWNSWSPNVKWTLKLPGNVLYFPSPFPGLSPGADSYNIRYCNINISLLYLKSYLFSIFKPSVSPTPNFIVLPHSQVSISLPLHSAKMQWT